MQEIEFNVSNAELIVMRVIWSLGEARVEEITCQLSPQLHWSVATVKTLLGRLVKKEMLGTEKEGRKFIYRPLLTECTAIEMMGESLLGKVCETKQVELLSKMIHLSSLTAEDVKTLQELLAEKEVVQEKSCSCLESAMSCACKHEHKVNH
jgi:CopY/TcrY family copper transport repressor